MQRLTGDGSLVPQRPDGDRELPETLVFDDSGRVAFALPVSEEGAQTDLAAAGGADKHY